MTDLDRLIEAFKSLARKYPEAAKELAKDFTAAIGVAKCKAELKKAEQEQMYVIEVKGVGRNRREYVAEFEAVFPAGTRILSVRWRE